MERVQTIKDIADKYPTSIKRLPLREQAAEADRRLSAAYAFRVEAETLLTVSDMAVVLGIDSDTVVAWMKGRSQNGVELVGNGSDEDKAAIQERAKVLKKWWELGASWGFQVAQSTKNAGAALFGLKAVYRFREYEDPKKVELSFKYDDLLKAVADAERETNEKNSTPDHTPNE